MSRPTVFLSYSHHDEIWKKRIAGHLRVLGEDLEVWDDRKIDLGDDWLAAIEAAIEQSCRGDRPGGRCLVVPARRN